MGNTNNAPSASKHFINTKAAARLAGINVTRFNTVLRGCLRRELISTSAITFVPGSGKHGKSRLIDKAAVAEIKAADSLFGSRKAKRVSKSPRVEQQVAPSATPACEKDTLNEIAIALLERGMRKAAIIVLQQAEDGSA